jgi:hypothetical protein
MQFERGRRPWDVRDLQDRVLELKGGTDPVGAYVFSVGPPEARPPVAAR